MLSGVQSPTPSLTVGPLHSTLFKQTNGCAWCGGVLVMSALPASHHRSVNDCTAGRVTALRLIKPTADRYSWTAGTSVSVKMCKLIYHIRQYCNATSEYSPISNISLTLLVYYTFFKLKAISSRYCWKPASKWMAADDIVARWSTNFVHSKTNRRRSLREITSIVNNDLSLPVSSHTISHLCACGYRRRKIWKTLTIARVNHMRHLSWCTARLFWHALGKRSGYCYDAATCQT